MDDIGGWGLSSVAVVIVPSRCSWCASSPPRRGWRRRRAPAASTVRGGRIFVFGCGYLGAVHATCMAKLGHEVIGVDVVGSRGDALSGGDAPFFEPGLAELLAEALGTGRLSFSTDAADAAGAQVHFLCVGTPQK